MKIKSIRFFSPQENSSKIEKSKPQAKPTGYITANGKLVLPNNTIEELGIEPENSKFKIGAEQGKRKLKNLYLIPTTDTSDTFSLVKSGRGYVIPLEFILKKGGVDFANNKYTFTITLFNYEDGVVGYELALSSSSVSAEAEEKPAYTGKPRGRKPKVETPAE